jgi:hypothetical protein
MSKKVGTVLAVLWAAVMAGMPVYAANLVLNGNFEDGVYNPTYPHYNDNDHTITNWVGGSGLDDETGPFWDGVVKVEQMSGTYVAFKQGAGIVSQEVEGFVSAKVYTLRFLERRRNCCVPSGATQLAPANLIVRVGGDEVVAEHPLPTTPFTQVTKDFTAVADGSLTLEFEMTTPEGGDNTMLLDAVSIVPKGEADPYPLNKPAGVVENPGWPINAVKLAAGQKITIDGKVTAEEYKGAQVMVIDKDTLVGIPDPFFPTLNHNGKIQSKDSLTNTSLADYTGTYYFMWDEQFFYAGLSARDNSYGFAGPDPNGSDCLQFVFAVSPGETATANMYIPTIAPAGADGNVLGKNAFGGWIEEDIMPASTYAGIVQDDGSWAVEIKIPWNSMTKFSQPIFPPKAGDSVGFAVLSIDYDVNDAGATALEWFACNQSVFPWESSGVEKLYFINAPSDAPKLSAVRSGNAVNIEWGGVGQLQSATLIPGSWTTITNAANPYVSGHAATEFFRVKQ